MRGFNNNGSEAAAKTKQLIMDVAEQLFAEHGFEIVSIRDITSKAKTSLSAVNYHFGTKEGLIAAIFDRRLTPLNQARLSSLDSVEKAAGKKGPRLEEVLRAFIAPAFDGGAEGKGTTIWKLLGKCFAGSNRYIDKLVRDHFEPIKERFDAAIRRAMPELTPKDLFWSMNFIISSVERSLLIIGRARPMPPEIKINEAEIIERLVNSGVAIMRTSLKK